MKMDVLDGMDEAKIRTAYKMKDGSIRQLPPLSAHEYEGITPVYESMPGWKESTFWCNQVGRLTCKCSEVHQTSRRVIRC